MPPEGESINFHVGASPYALYNFSKEKLFEGYSEMQMKCAFGARQTPMKWRLQFTPW